MSMEKKSKHYEYELCIAKLDTNRGAVRVSNIKLSQSSAFSFSDGYGFCGLDICSIQATRTAEKEKPQAVAQMPTTQSR